MMRNLKTIIILIFALFAVIKGESNHKIPLFLSIVIPGGGQIYNGKYLKAGIYIAAESLFIYGALVQDQRLNDTRDEISDLQSDPLASGNIAKLEYLEDRYKKERNNFIWMGIATVLLSAGDAYVDSYFSDFKSNIISEGDKLSFKPMINGLNITYSWK